MKMDMTSNVPGWLTPVAWIYIAAALAGAALIAYDIYGRGSRLTDRGSELVWVSSGLYLGPFAVPLYRRHARRRVQATSGTLAESSKPTVISGLHGGSASALAHLIGVPLVLASGLTIAGINLWVMIIVIGIVAIALLAVYEQTTHGRQTVLAAVGTAVITVLAFDIGMVAWMLLLHYNAFMPPPSDGVFWFLMQLGILAGLVTGYPVVKSLARYNRATAPA